MGEENLSAPVSVTARSVLRAHRGNCDVWKMHLEAKPQNQPETSHALYLIYI